MKNLIKIVAVAGMMFLTSGCSTSSQGKLEGLNADACKNPKCQCPKPCQCGSGCRCGMNGNSISMDGK